METEGVYNIQPLGFKLNVEDFYQNSSVLMLTSQFEGYPMVVAEALSHGLPVVSFEMPYLAFMKCGVI
jgi:glycosyltransferase involved in cell wall biosynthesis